MLLQLECHQSGQHGLTLTKLAVLAKHKM